MLVENSKMRNIFESCEKSILIARLGFLGKSNPIPASKTQMKVTKMSLEVDSNIIKCTFCHF